MRGFGCDIGELYCYCPTLHHHRQLSSIVKRAEVKSNAKYPTRVGEFFGYAAPGGRNFEVSTSSLLVDKVG